MATAVLQPTVVIWPLSTNDYAELGVKLPLFVDGPFLDVFLNPIWDAENNERDDDEKQADSTETGWG